MGCHGRRLKREDGLALAYARGEVDRESYLAQRGRLSEVPGGTVGAASERAALERALIDLKNRISALREDRGRLVARLRTLEAGIGGALDRDGLEARDLFAEKLALKETLATTEAALRRAEAARAALEAELALRAAEVAERLSEGGVG